MMISEKIKRLQSVNLNTIINDSARDHEAQIISMNQDQMYKKGVMNVKTGKRESYAESTKRQKKRRATYKKTDFITLRWFGDLYESMKLIFFRDRFVISADDLKWNFLGENPRFGNALGLTDKSMTKLKKMLLPSIIAKLKSRI